MAGSARTPRDRSDARRAEIRESKPTRAALVFAKFPSSITGPNDPIVVDVELTTQVDWEVELGVIVGHGMRNVAVGAALDYVFGYPVGNDVSARDVQFSESQWTRGRSFAALEIGDVVECEVERIGMLRNSVTGVA